MSKSKKADITVIIAIKDIESRGYVRIFNNLYSLSIQTQIPEVFIVDGSNKEKFAETDEYIKFFSFAKHVFFPQEVFNKSLLYNIGIRMAKTKYLLMSDIDYMYERNFIETVGQKLTEHNFILCRSMDLPEKVEITLNDIKNLYQELKSTGSLHIISGDGACQASLASWFYKVRGYDERMKRLGAMDNDMHKRAKLDSLKIVWIQNTSLLHQWHFIEKWKTPIDREQLEKNRDIFMNDNTIKRNPHSWGKV